MDNVALGSDPDRRQENELASLFDAPAYIRRSRGVYQALETVLANARHRRDEILAMPRLRLGTLHALAGGYADLIPFLAEPGEVAVLEGLHAMLSPSLRLPPAPTTSARVLGHAVGQLVESLTRFNRRWLAQVEKLDPQAVNDLRDKYNRYYLIEKSCSLRSDLLARQGFKAMPPLDVEEILSHLPLLPVPRLGEA